MMFYIQMKIRQARDGVLEEVSWNFWTAAANKEQAMRCGQSICAEHGAYDLRVSDRPLI